MKLSATHTFNCIDLMVKFGCTSCEDIPPALSHMVHAQKCYIVVIPWALGICLIYTPSALGPVALGLRVYISGKPLVPVL